MKWADKSPEEKQREVERVARWAAENRERVAENKRRWVRKNRAKIRVSQRAWRGRNPEKMRAKRLRHAQRNPKASSIRGKSYYGRNVESQRLRSAEWRRKNPAIFLAQKAAQRARKIERSHPSADLLKIKAIFDECARLSKTGVKHDVDHIIPLSRGGWHHQDNLQVLPSTVNGSKHNDPFWELAGYKSWRDVPEHLWPEALANQYRLLKIAA